MSEESVILTLDRAESSVNTVMQLTESSVTDVKDSVREHCLMLKEETTLRVSAAETGVIRSAAVVSLDGDYHLLRAYFHASPSLLALLLLIYGFISSVIAIVNVINSILKVITGETLAYWLDKLIPGFQSSWYKLMSHISTFSSILGWGMDGVHHLLNIANMGADLWGMVTNKERDTVMIEKYKRADTLMTNYSKNLSYWQADPGRMISQFTAQMSYKQDVEGKNFMLNLISKLDGAGEKIETLFKGLGGMTAEFLSLRSDMPAFIAKNIPQALWDAVGYADTMINDRLLPGIDRLTDRINELDNLLDKYASDASALVQKIARPGDMLAEIASLPDYVRKDQEDKIDSVVSAKLDRDNVEAYESRVVDLREFAKVQAAMRAPLPPPEFMLIEAPGRPLPPDITAEPRETWLVGDF